MFWTSSSWTIYKIFNYCRTKFFFRSKLQEKKFQYGLRMETNTITISWTSKSSDDSDKDKDEKEKKRERASEDTRKKGSTDETESTEELLKTLSSFNSSSGNQKQEKGTSSSESEMHINYEDHIWEKTQT